MGVKYQVKNHLCKTVKHLQRETECKECNKKNTNSFFQITNRQNYAKDSFCFLSLGSLS